MEEEFNKALDTIDDMPDFNFSGKLDFKISKELVERIEILLKDKYNKSVIRKKLYFLTVEMIQNVRTHGVINDKMNTCIKSKMLESKFYLLTQNIILSDKTDKLIEKLKVLNEVSSDYEKIKRLYKSKLNEGTFDKSIRGIGLIEIIRKSKNKILYNFEKIDDQNLKISLIVTVDIS